uniref:VWFA domain-containing protein n=1 Tax=Strongyloides papillosus TaxID=174720 RepID=A0A0N5C253_STREA
MEKKIPLSIILIFLINLKLILSIDSNFIESNSFFQENDPLYSSFNCLFEVEENSCPNGDPLQNCDTDIILSIDASTDALPSLLFQKEINLIRDNITLDWTNFNKVALTWYNEKPFVTYKFGQINSKSQFDNFLNAIQQSSGSKLSLLLNELNNIPTTLGNKLSTFIFISSSTNEEINEAIQYANQLKQKGTLNFIILGNIITETDLKPLNASNIFYWTFADYCIEPLINFFINSLDCKQQCSNATTPNSLITTTIPPITISSTIGSSLSTITNYSSNYNIIHDWIFVPSTIPSTIGSSLSTITETSTISPTSIPLSTISPTIGSSLSTITETSTISPTSIQTSTISSTIGSSLSTTNEISTVSIYSTYSSSSKMTETTESTSTVTTTIPSIPPKCNNSVYFVIDHRQNITDNEFYDIKDITSNWDISINQASIDVNSLNETNIFLTFPQQPKSDITLMTNTKQWNCMIAYLGQSANDFQKYCNRSLLPIIFPKEEQDHTMDQFLLKFYNFYLNELKIKVEISKLPNEFSLILFSKTGNQTEIDNFSQILINITSKLIKINPVFVKLPNSFNGNFGSIENYDFNDPDLGEKISDSICS